MVWLIHSVSAFSIYRLLSIFYCLLSSSDAAADHVLFHFPDGDLSPVEHTRCQSCRYVSGLKHFTEMGS